MKRTALRSRQLLARSIAWREAEYAALQVNAEDARNDRLGEDIFDVEDEHEEVDIIVQGMISR